MPNNLPREVDAPAQPMDDDELGKEFGRTLDHDAWGEEEQFSWSRYMAALWRYKWLVLLAVALGAGAGAALSRLQPVEYEARTTIWIDAPGREEASGPIQSSALFQSSRMSQSSGWVDLLKSYVVLDPVVREKQLYLRARSSVDPSMFDSFDVAEEVEPGTYTLEVDESAEEFVLLDEGGAILERGAVGDSIGTRLGFLWAPSADALPRGQPVEFTVRNPRGVSRYLISSLNTDLDRDGNFLRVSLRGLDPERAADLLNAVTDRYVEVATQLKSAKSRELTELLGEQLQYAARNLRAAEASLQDFRVGTMTRPSQPASPLSPGLDATEDAVLENYFDMKVREELVRRDRQALERVLATARDSALSVEALEVIPTVQEATELREALDQLTSSRAELRSLRGRYTSAHPPVQRLRKEIESLETQTIPELIEALIGELEARQSSLEQLIRSASSELREIPTRAIEEARLRRRVQTAEDLTQSLQKRYEEARLGAASTVADVRVLDRALPPQTPATRGRAPFFILLGALGGLGLGLVGAVFGDRIDPRLRYPEQVSEDLGLPILGTIPHLETGNGRLSIAGDGRVTDAFRNVRLNLVHAYGTAAPLVVTITSPGAEDGKSIITSNLALAFAGLELRTLVIDGDLRRGSLHRQFDRRRRPGLTDYLCQDLSRDQLVQSTAHELVRFVGSGRRLENGPELLQSAEMSSLLAHLRSEFDVVLVDSPPLAAGIDPFVLGTLTGNLLLVLRAGTTNRDLAEAKLGLVDRLPIRILGAVLNDVPETGSYRYYYSYLPGYESRTEEGRPATSRSG